MVDSNENLNKHTQTTAEEIVREHVAGGIPNIAEKTQISSMVQVVLCLRARHQATSDNLTQPR